METPRTRSRVACQRCNRRKVKCDVAETDAPCSNCRQDEQSCVILPRKKHRPRRKRNASGALVPRTDIDSSIIEGNTFLAETDVTLPIIAANAASRRAFAATAEPRSSIGLEDSDDAALDPTDLEAPQDARARMPAKPPSHRPHEIEYMRQQGVFSPLPAEVCDELIKCYFHHVHFFLPILDAPAFLNGYCSRGVEGLHPLLLWSVFLASANFIDINTLRRAGFTSRKAMKTAMYDRAKCLYDLDRGTDKLTLIRSVILLAFWYSDPQEHTGAWYWIGIAISLAQASNLHRTPGSRNGRQNTPGSTAMMRRIWWSLVIRDRWIALARGRPMRIHSDSYDLDMPTDQDVLSDLGKISARAKAEFIPDDTSDLAEMWLRIVRVSDILGDVLSLHCRVRGPQPSTEEIDTLSHRLDNLALGASNKYQTDDIQIHSLQTELLYHAAIAILYRPYVLMANTSNTSTRNPQWERQAVRCGREAASGTNSLLEKLIELDAIKYLKPMMITAMVPATQIHLADCKSGNSLISGLGKNKLQLCLLVFGDLRATYWSADVMYRLFHRAEMLLADKDPPATKDARTHSPTPDTSVEQVAEQQLLAEDAQASAAFPDANLLPTEPMAAFFNGSSPLFSDVDQLLSPGFALSEDVFLDFFPNYPAGNYSDTMAPLYY